MPARKPPTRLAWPGRPRTGHPLAPRRSDATRAARAIRSLLLTNDDQDTSTSAIVNFRHAGIGTSSLNTVPPSSRLLIPGAWLARWRPHPKVRG